MGGTRGRWLVVPAVLALAAGLAACGGSATGSAPAASPTQAAPAGAGSTDAGAGAPSSAPDPTTGGASTDPGTGGGASGDACAVVAAGEMATVLGKPSVDQKLYAGPPDTCSFELDGVPLAALVLVGKDQGAGLVYDTMKADPNSDEFAGIGDRALYNSQTQTFLVQKGDRLVTIVVTGVELDEAQRVETLQEIARIAAGRL